MTPLNDRDIDVRLKQLKKEFERNEQLMRKAALDYEDLVAAKEDLATSINELKKSRTQKRMTALQT